MKLLRFVLGSLLLTSSLTAAEVPGAANFERIHDHGAYVVRSVDGKTVCNDATPGEALRINARPAVATRVFGEESGRIRGNASAGLNIVLQGTAQLDANPQAKAAFQRAAEIWESKIADEVTVYVKVDFGSTRFGDPFEENVIASASSDIRYAASGALGEVRGLLISHANNANETAVYNALPSTTLPTDIGATSGVASASILFRALGAMDPATPDDENNPNIGFNSAFPYDFDPSNGISPGQTDFEGVVVHEIGHMLGFVSSVGYKELGSNLPPTIFDFFRFRPGVTLGTFAAAQRVQSSGGTHVYFTGTGTKLLSTGRADGTGGDENQASHWKDDAIAGSRIGVMDPTLSKGARSELTDADLQAFGMMGYDIVGGGETPVGQLPAAPSNLTATATGTTTLRLNWSDNSNNETEFRIEQKSGAAFVDIGKTDANATQIDIGLLSAGTPYTFRVRARNATGDSGYTNEATTTTNSNPGACTPSSTTVCLLNNRFRVRIDYVNPFSNPPNQPGTFLAARLNTQAGVNPDTALFGFSSATAVEVVVRLQDTRPFANRFDVYYGGMTDVGYTVTVTDTQTGTTRTYTNNVGKVGGGVDRTSFPTTVLGMPDRLITSSGHDSFPAEPLAVPRLGLDLVGAGSTAPRKASRMVAGNTSVSLAKVTQKTANAGGAGACAEAEPNETMALSDPLTLGQPCTGSANISDASSYAILYDLNDDQVPDVEKGVQDVFSVTTAAAGPLTVNLTFTNASADLDVFLFVPSGNSLSVLDGAASENTTETFTTDPLPAGTYYVAVLAYTGGSAYTLTAGGSTPAAPTNLTATGTSTSVIHLSWSDNAHNETSYIVEQKVGANFVQLISLDANATALNVTNFQPSTTATFRVKARNGSGDSAYSNEATGTTNGAGGTGCTPNSTTLCLLNNRFRVRIDYVNPFSNPPNQPGTFLAERLNTQAGVNPDTGLYGFSNARAVEVVVRIQDTRPFANRFDVYYGGMTDVGYTVTVTDTQTGTTRTYTNSVGTVGGGVDRNSFPAN